MQSGLSKKFLCKIPAHIFCVSPQSMYLVISLYIHRLSSIVRGKQERGMTAVAAVAYTAQTGVVCLYSILVVATTRRLSVFSYISRKESVPCRSLFTSATGLEALIAPALHCTVHARYTVHCKELLVPVRICLSRGRQNSWSITPYCTLCPIHSV